MRAGYHSIVPRKKAKLLHRMMVELAGNAMIALEGRLSACRLDGCVETPPTAPFRPKRTCLVPRLDFVVLDLAPVLVEPVFKQIMAAGLQSAVIHIQIVRDGVLQFAAYDNFDPDCVVVGPAVSAVKLEELKKEGLVRSFESCENPAKVAPTPNHPEPLP